MNPPHSAEDPHQHGDKNPARHQWIFCDRAPGSNRDQGAIPNINQFDLNIRALGSNRDQ